LQFAFLSSQTSAFRNIQVMLDAQPNSMQLAYRIQVEAR
jgi:hypothetical protein